MFLRYSNFLMVLLLLGWGITLQAQTVSKMSTALSKVVSQQQSDEIIVAWVFFKDKGTNLAQQLDAAKAELSQKALQRRLRHLAPGKEVDFYDMPIYPQYIQTIGKQVRKIRVESRWLNAVSVEATAGQMKQIAQLGFVKEMDKVFAYVSPLPKSMPTAVDAPVESIQQPEGVHRLNYGASFNQVNQINVVALHDKGYDGKGVMVAVFDDGFNSLKSHAAFQKMTVLKTWDFVNGNDIVWDQPGHGSHGTNTLSTLGANVPGQLIGPAYNATFMLARTEISSKEIRAEEDYWVAASEWAERNGADIISSSLGYRDKFNNPSENYTWRDMDGKTTRVTRGANIAAAKGVLIVNSAGNSGDISPPQNTLGAPSDGRDVLAVGALTASGSRVGFSSVGPTADGRIKPDVMAQGSGVTAASPRGGYTRVSGTSFSCPLTAGAAALVLQAKPAWSNVQIINALRKTAGNASSPNSKIGWGTVNADKAASMVVSQTEQENQKSTFADDSELAPVYPNPFNPSTRIRYTLFQKAQIKLAVYNILGEQVKLLWNGSQAAGVHQMIWNAVEVPSGIYFVVLSSDQQRKVQRAILLK